jgi:hypothetical protein
MRMHQTPPEHDPPGISTKHGRPGLLSQSDPSPDTGARNRLPVILIIAIVLLIGAVVVLHLTGVVGSGGH